MKKIIGCKYLSKGIIEKGITDKGCTKLLDYRKWAWQNWWGNTAIYPFPFLKKPESCRGDKI